MMIVSIPPKAGRLATGAYASNPVDQNPVTRVNVAPVPSWRKGKTIHETADVFGAKAANQIAPATQGGLSMPDDRTQTVYGNPLASFRDTGTIMPATPLTTRGALNSTAVVSPWAGRYGNKTATIMPHEKGVFFRRIVVPREKTQFGATKDPTSTPADTAFHPQRQPIQQNPAPKSAPDYSRHPAPPAWNSRNHVWNDPNNSFTENRHAPASSDRGIPRWSVLKRGAAG